MAEGLSRKRKVRGGHRSSTKRTISVLYESIESTKDTESVVTKLEQCRITLKEKLETLRQLDEEILELVEEGEVNDEIEQSDFFKERIHVAIIDSNKALEAKQNSRILASMVPPSGDTDSDSPAAVTSSKSSAEIVTGETATTVVASSESSTGIVTSETTTDTVSPTLTSVTPVSMVTPLVMSPAIKTTTARFSVAATESVSTPVAPLMFSPTVSMVSIHPHLPLIGSSSIMSMTPTLTTVSSASLFGTPASSVVGHATRVKLPKLAPKKFNGDLTRWSTFWDSFESSIHHHPDLTDIDRFNYLHTLLEGPAADAISGLKLTSANYSEAIEILKK